MFSLFDGIVIAVLGAAAGFCAAKGIKYSREWWKESRAAKKNRRMEKYADRALAAAISISALATVLGVDEMDETNTESEQMDDDGLVTYLTFRNSDTEEIAAVLTDLKKNRFVVEYSIPLADENNRLKWSKVFNLDDAENAMGFEIISWITECRETDMAEEN